jgi:hypothetical protein
MEDQNIAPIPAHEDKSSYPLSAPVAPNRIIVPGTIGAMIIGIIAVILCWFCWIPVAGFFFFVPSFVMGLLAFLRASKREKMLKENPEKYTVISAGFLKTARITGLISFIASSATLIAGVIWLLVQGNKSGIF